ncbi:MAG: cyclic-di-AMP receptor [Anaerolineae bacterium]
MSDDEHINRMAITIVDGGQSRDLLKALNEEQFPATILDAVGGFLHEAMVTLIVGMSEQRLQDFFALVREKCPSRTRYVPMGVELSLSPGYPMMIEARVGGATVFVLPVERFVKL